jgi:hypothetical protein
MTDKVTDKRFASTLLAMARAAGRDDVVVEFRRILRSMTDRQLTELLHLRLNDVFVIKQEVRRRGSTSAATSRRAS